MAGITSEAEAQNTAGCIAKLSERRKLVRLEETCLTALIDDLTNRLLEYRSSQPTPSKESES